MVFITGWFYCINQSWFEEYHFEPGKMPPNPCYQETTIYFLLCMSTISAALVFAPKQPHSRHILNNKLFTGWLVAAVVLLLCLMFIDDPGLEHWMNFKNPPHAEYHAYVLLLGLAGGVLCYCWEVYFIHGFVYQWVRPHLKENLPSRHAYQKIEKQLMAQPDWPRMGENTISDGANRLIVEEHDLKNQWKIPLFKGRTGVRMKNRNDSAHGAVVMSTLEAADELSCVVVDNQRESVDGSFPPPPSEKELLLLVPPSPSATAANDSQSQSIDCVYHQAKTHLG